MKFGGKERIVRPNPSKKRQVVSPRSACTQIVLPSSLHGEKFAPGLGKKALVPPRQALSLDFKRPRAFKTFRKETGKTQRTVSNSHPPHQFFVWPKVRLLGKLRGSGRDPCREESHGPTHLSTASSTKSSPAQTRLKRLHVQDAALITNGTRR